MKNREIAIFTDVHGLLEPLEAILKDIKKRGIKEIYSLGDNIGVGPNPNEVLDLLDKYHVKSVAGNSEYYSIIGIAPFRNFFGFNKIASQDWTKSKLSKKNLEMIKKYPASIELELGNKKVSLCHFANDVRIDFMIHSTWTYQDELKYGNKAYLQFDYTNSDEQKKDILKNKDKPTEFYNGFRSSYQDPLFKGKKISEFDIILQGHVHFRLYDESSTTKFYTLGMAYKEKDLATYTIVKELDKNILVKEVLVKFDRNKMLDKIEKSDMPDKSLINKYIFY